MGDQAPLVPPIVVPSAVVVAIAIPLVISIPLPVVSSVVIMPPTTSIEVTRVAAIVRPRIVWTLVCEEKSLLC